MNPISNPAFYCCGIRMRDASQKRPVCGDTYARHRYIDDFLRMILRYRSLGLLNPLLRLLMPGGYSGYTMRVFEAPHI